ncbi:uncharacterized protein BDCG_17661 [Blastomyces dermatitidis ER-3]|uniref:Uncharacterized protein n=1 Tax=Ajellomyces dermatitidis (strain ER-3 / ATCC MYA-2586) TaxID=559297 RepID=A0ABX2VZN4_AJEDR|nr:uncharacterized protein BDCG_17661 [Blastomyces dermatitidis ER-3]OAT02599.1 hypothetical protein BDCG_17661 [Blastomyces dermatitidis ER-3]
MWRGARTVDREPRYICLCLVGDRAGRGGVVVGPWGRRAHWQHRELCRNCQLGSARNYLRGDLQQSVIQRLLKPAYDYRRTPASYIPYTKLIGGRYGPFTFVSKFGSGRVIIRRSYVLPNHKRAGLRCWEPGAGLGEERGWLLARRSGAVAGLRGVEALARVVAPLLHKPAESDQRCRGDVHEKLGGGQTLFAKVLELEKLEKF